MAVPVLFRPAARRFRRRTRGSRRRRRSRSMPAPSSARSGAARLQAIPPTQWEAGASLGLGFLDQLRYIIVPQAVRIAIPPTVGFLVQLIKNTSLAAVIGFVELTREGQITNASTFRPMTVYRHRRGDLFRDVLPAHPVEPIPGAEPACRSLSCRTSSSASAPTPCSTASRSRSSRARSSPSSAAPDRARAPCCAASTASSRSRTAASLFDGVTVNDPETDLRTLRQRVGIVFQSYNLFPHLSVEKNITLAPRVVKQMPESEARALARDGPAQGRARGEDRRPIPTSSRAASSSASRSPARSPCSPQLMLFDEITSALDPELIGEVLKVLEAMAAGRHDDDRSSPMRSALPSAWRRGCCSCTTARSGKKAAPRIR